MWIAERTLYLVDPATLERKPVVIRIAAPAPVTESNAFACAVQVEGLLDDIQPIQGTDAFQAIEEACRFVHNYLSQCKHARHLQWPTGESYFEPHG